MEGGAPLAGAQAASQAHPPIPRREGWVGGGGVSMGNRGARVTSQGPSTRINKHMATEITCYANEALFLWVFLSGFFLGYPF